MTAKLQWGILSTGAIAKTFARALTQSKTGKLVAVASRSAEAAAKFTKELACTGVTEHASYEALLADPNVQAVYIAPPHVLHGEWTIRALEAGKHVLCEKPLSLNHAYAMRMIETARVRKLFLAEAFMYRCHPQTAKLVELIRSGVIGEIMAIQASFAFRAGANPENRALNNALGGGGILDVGCYPVSIARLIAGAAMNKPFADPTDVQAVGYLGKTNVDEYAMAVLKFSTSGASGASGGDIIASVATGVRVSMDNQTRIFGTDGSIVLENPWQASRGDPTPGKIIINKGGKQEVVETPAERNSFAYEADAVADAINAGQCELTSPAMSWGDTLGNLKTLDQWRQKIGLIYEAEKPENCKATVTGRPLKVCSKHNMKYGTIPGLDKKVSRFIFGCDNQTTFPHAQVMFDAWFERGGNAFDTAFVYGGGMQEKLLGQWIKARGVADQVVVTVKGGHTPCCNPTDIVKQFKTSLERLQLDRADIYIMHRDNLDLPAGELVDCLSELIDQKLLQVFGGSNWSIDRFEQANAYAKKHGRHPMTILNNNLSLALQIKPLWGGCVHSSDPKSLARLEQLKAVHFAWSSQARGYFLDDDQWQKLGPANFECWDCEENRARRQRAFELAKQKGVSAINIAAAYVLNQPFESFALVGPRTVEEIATTLPGLDITLTPAELAYLSMQTDAVTA